MVKLVGPFRRSVKGMLTVFQVESTEPPSTR